MKVRSGSTTEVWAQEGKLLYIFVKSLSSYELKGWHLLVTQQDRSICGRHRKEVLAPQMSPELFINIVSINLKLAGFNLGLKID